MAVTETKIPKPERQIYVADAPGGSLPEAIATELEEGVAPAAIVCATAAFSKP